MQKLDLNNMALFTNNYTNKVEINDELYLELTGLCLDDLNYLMEKIPSQTILNFVEGFSEQDLEGFEDYVLEKAQKSFTDIFYSVIAAGSKLYHQEQYIKNIPLPKLIKAFKVVIKQTIPQNKEEMEVVEEALSQIVDDDAKKLKAILKNLKEIIQIIMK